MIVEPFNIESGASDEEIARVARAAAVEGWLSDREGVYLYALAKRFCSWGSVVEIGSWKGKSTIWLAKGVQAGGGGKVYTIDPHTPDGESEGALRENLIKARVDHVAEPVVRSSVEALRGWEKPVALLWVDGDHKYRGVRADFFGWYPHVIEGGVVALHDTLNREGVRRFVERHVLRLVKKRKLLILGQVEEILAVQKLRPLSSRDLAWRKLFLWLEVPRRRHGLARYATNLGKRHLRTGDYRRARECFRLAFTYQPLYWKNLRRLALSYVPALLGLYHKTRSRR